MSVQKKNEKWYAAVYSGIGPDGKQVVEWSEGFEKKSEAQLVELEMKRNVLLNNHKVYDKASFSYVAERWLIMRSKTVAKTTHRMNKGYYDTHIDKFFKDYLVKDIEPVDIMNFMLSMDLAPATINKVMNILKQILDFAVTLKYITVNPCNGIKKPTIKRTKKETWTPEQINEFLSLKDVKRSTCYTALLILFSTGMRPGEVCGLRWCDWYGDYLLPNIGIDSKREETDLKNDKAHDPVYIDIKIQTQLKRLKLAQESIYKSNGGELPSDGFINCLMPDFRPMTVNYLRQRFQAMAKRNGFSKIPLYCATRHSFGTNMMKDGVNPKMVADMMRHTTVRTTLDNYSHTDEKMYKDTIKQYNNKLLRRVK